MHRGVADLLHHLRIPGVARILRGALRHPVRQELEPAETGLAASGVCGAVGTAPVAPKSFAGSTLYC